MENIRDHGGVSFIDLRRYSYVLHQKSGNAGFPLVPDYMADPERPADFLGYALDKEVADYGKRGEKRF